MPDSRDQTQSTPERRAGFPLLTVTLCFLCLLMTIANVSSPGTQSGFWHTLGQFGYMDVSAIWGGHWQALFTSVFVHGSRTSFMSTLLHLSFNLMWLLALGRILEETIHIAQVALFFILAAMVASACEIAFSNVAPNGVSGVVYAMFGLMWAGRKQYPDWAEAATPKNMQVFVGWGLFCLLVTQLKIMRIANAAHFGGLAFGLVVGNLFVAKTNRVQSLAAILGMTALTFASVKWMPWSWVWNDWKGMRLQAGGQMEEAYDYYKRSLSVGAPPALVWQRILVLEQARGNQVGAREALGQLMSLGRVTVQPIERRPQPEGGFSPFGPRP